MDSDRCGGTVSYVFGRAFLAREMSFGPNECYVPCLGSAIDAANNENGLLARHTAADPFPNFFGFNRLDGYTNVRLDPEDENIVIKRLNLTGSAVTRARAMREVAFHLDRRIHSLEEFIVKPISVDLFYKDQQPICAYVRGQG